MENYYEILQVAKNASPEVIKGAYKYLSQKWHPDKNPENRAEAEMMVKSINDAYKKLLNPKARKDLDDWISQQEKKRCCFEKIFVWK